MGCARSKNRSHDEIYPGEETEGGANRYDGTHKSNESLIITVLWRRLSMFSRRGSTRRHSVSVKTASSSIKSMAVPRSPEAGAAESPGGEQTQQQPPPPPPPQQQQQQQPGNFKLPELQEEGENL